MNEYTLIRKNISEKGWSIIKSDNLIKLNKFRSFFIKQLNTYEKFNKITDIDQIRHISNNLKDKDFNYIRNLYFNELSKKIINLHSKVVLKLFSKNILAQRFPTIRFHMGNVKSTMLNAHIESMSGHSPFTYNLWMPLHDINDETGIWLMDQKDSLKICKLEANGNYDRNKLIKNSNKKKFIKLKFGESILFNTFVFHGSDFHKVNKARISIDIRFQKFEAPLLNKSIEYFTKFNI